MSKLLKPTDEAKDAFLEMGLTVQDLDPTVHTLTEILLQLRAAQFGVAESSQMFRSRTAGSAAVLVQNAEAVAYLSSRLEMATGFTSDMAEAQKTTLVGSLQLAKQELQNLGTELGGALAPSIVEMTKALKEGLAPAVAILGGLFKWMAKNMALVQTVLKGVIVAFSAWILYMKVAKPLMALLTTAHYAYIGALVLEGDTEVANTTIKWASIAATNAASKAYKMLTATILGIPGLGALLAGLSIVTGFVAAFAISNMTAAKAAAKVVPELTKEEQAVKKMVDAFTAGGDTIEEVSKKIQGRVDNFAIELIKQGNSLGRNVAWLSQYFTDGAADYSAFWQYCNEHKIELGDLKGEKGLERIMNILGGVKTRIDAIGTVKPFFSDISDKDTARFKDFMELTGKLSTTQRGLVDAFLQTTKGTSDYDVALRKVSVSLLDFGPKAFMMIDVLKNMNDKTNSYVDAEKKLAYATEELTSAQNAYNNGGQTNIDVQERLVKATDAYHRANRDLIGVIGGVLRGIRQIPGNMDYYISEMEKASEANAKMEALRKDSINVARNEATALQELTDALLTYGAGTDEAVQAQEKLNSAIKEKVDVDAQMTQLDIEAADSSQIVSKALKGEAASYAEVDGELKFLNTEEKEILTFVQEVINARDALIKALSDQEIAEANLGVIEKVRAEGTKYLADKTKNLYDLEDKIFGIEADLYKLRKDETKQVDGLFESLASQGMISDDMVDKYKDMKIAEGDVMKLNNDYTEVIAGLTPEQKALEKAFMDTTKGGAGYDEALQNLIDSGASGVGTIVAMNDAQDNLTKSLKDVKGEMLPVIQNLVDTGVISSETAKQYYDLIDNAAELAGGNQDLKDTQVETTESFKTLTNVIGQMGKALITGEAGATNMADVYGQLGTQLGIVAPDFEEMTNLLNLQKKADGKFYDANGKVVDSLDDFSDGDLALAAALKMSGTTLQLYEDGMSGLDLATQLNIISQKNAEAGFNNLKNAANEAINPLKSYGQAITDVGTFSDGADTKVHLLEEAVSDLRTEIEGKGAPVFAVDTTQAVEDFDYMKGIYDTLKDYLEGTPVKPKLDTASVLERIKGWRDRHFQTTQEMVDDSKTKGDKAGEDYYNGLINWLNGIPDWFGVNVVDKIGSLWDTFVSGLGKVGDAAKGIVGSIGDAIFGNTASAAKGTPIPDTKNPVTGITDSLNQSSRGIC
jgi:hypothetical protein